MPSRFLFLSFLASRKHVLEVKLVFASRKLVQNVSLIHIYYLFCLDSNPNFNAHWSWSLSSNVVVIAFLVMYAEFLRVSRGGRGPYNGA